MELQRLPSFDPGFTDNLRTALGDWRAPVTLPASIFDDVVARTALYAERGLDRYLTAFPAAAFRESLSIAGLSEAPPALATPYFTDLMNRNRTRRLDFNAPIPRMTVFCDSRPQIRRFIDERMKAAYGDRWVKHRVPGPIRQNWEDKKEKAQDSGQEDWPLISYADFTDYVTIITQNDNWTAVFKSVFGRRELVRESFQRLYPIRLCTMHARIITQDDELYLHVETMRILKAIGVID